MPIEKVCLNCGKTFQVVPTYKDAKYCSRQCYYTYSRRHLWGKQKPNKACLVCGKQFYVSPSKVKRAKYCSKKCQIVALHKEGRGKWRYNFSKTRLERLYQKENKTIRQIAKELGCHPATVSFHMERLGVRQRDKRGKKANLKKDELVELYVERRLFQTQIARRLAVHVSTVKRYMKKYGISTRKEIGENHPSWKGGRIKNADGYILVKARWHPRANANGYVREHLLVWEKTHKCSLSEGYVIHHLNGIKEDNRPKNLVAIPRRKHKTETVVKLLQQRILDLEQQLATVI